MLFRSQAVTAALSFAMADDILWADQLGALVAATPPGVGITGLDYLGASPLTAVEASTDPLVTTGVGRISFTALAEDVPDTVAWAEALNAVPGFSGARISNARMSDEPLPRSFRYQVTGTIEVDSEALSHRFDAQPEERS